MKKGLLIISIMLFLSTAFPFTPLVTLQHTIGISYSPEESYYPASNGYTVAYNGTAGPDSSIGNYTLTWDDEMTDYDGLKDTAGGYSYVILNFTIAPIQNFGGFNYSVMHAAFNDDDDNSELWVYNWVTDDWVYLAEGGKGLGAWSNGTVSGPQYSDGTEVLIRATSTDADSSSGVAVLIAWLEIFSGPPWLDGYAYRTRINITGSSGAGTDYVLKWRVEYTGGSDFGSVVYTTKHCQTDFGDVRWTEDDGTTMLSYYLDEYNSTATSDFDKDATFYVRISANLTTNQFIYIYYGTVGTSTTTSNGPNTFYEWLDADDVGGWTKSNMQVSNYGGYLRFYNPTAALFGSAQRYDLSYPPDRWRMLVRLQTTSINNVDRGQISNTDGNAINRFNEFFAPNYGDQTHYYYWGSGETQGLSWIEGNEYVVQITVNEGDSSTGVTYQIWYSGMTTHGLYSSKPFRSGSPTDADGIYITDGSSSTNIDMRVKYIALMKNLATEPFVDGYGAYGIEEYSGAFTATTTTTPIIIGELWGFNAAFVILGLVMIPASGLYLVKGGRKEANMDKFYYALVAFFIGWALVIGVIMP